MLAGVHDAEKWGNPRFRTATQHRPERFAYTTTQNTGLITQLDILLRLTAQEAATARGRLTQVTADATRREFTQHAAQCDKRAQAIRQAVRDLGGAPDMVGMTLGKAVAVAKFPLEQAMPITEALLADLALEHQLFDRARLVQVLAADADAPDLVALAERLETAHGTTIQWLFTVLSETAIGGPAALAPTGLQVAAATARSAATFAGSSAATGLNKAVATAGNVTGRLQGSANQSVTSQVGRVSSLAGGVKSIFRVGRDATLAETEKQVSRELGKDRADAMHHAREQLGALSAAELPIRGFDGLTAQDVTAKLNRMTNADDIQVILAYEKAHKHRAGVVTAGTKRIRQIAKDLVEA